MPDGWRRAPDAGGRTGGWNVESVVRAQRAKWDRFVALIGERGGTAPLAVYHEVATLSNDSLVAHHTFMTYGYVLALAARLGRRARGQSAVDSRLGQRPRPLLHRQPRAAA